MAAAPAHGDKRCSCSQDSFAWHLRLLSLLQAVQPLAALLAAPATPQLRAAAASTLAVLLQGRPRAAESIAATVGGALRGLLADIVPGALGAGRGSRAGAELLLVRNISRQPYCLLVPQSTAERGLLTLYSGT